MSLKEELNKKEENLIEELNNFESELILSNPLIRKEFKIGNAQTRTNICFKLKLNQIGSINYDQPKLILPSSLEIFVQKLCKSLKPIEFETMPNS